MNFPAIRDSRLESIYARALRLYPESFRCAYAEAMLQTFRDALRDNSLPRRQFLPLVLRDFLTSILKENLTMLRDTFARPALVFNALILAVLATGLALALYAIPQQVLRQGANDPQIAMAGDLSAKLVDGVAPSAALPTGTVDAARSLTPFLIVYDDAGHPVASQATLNGQSPVPPAGVFQNVREHGEARITWQPRRDARIAAVIERVSGPNPGFVLAGRNMREVEARTEQVKLMAGFTWICMLGVILLGTVAFGWYTRPRASVSAPRAA